RTAPAFIAGAAKILDQLGFYSLWVPEHVLLFSDYASRYPYSENGRIPGDPEGVLDPFSTLTYVAAHTQQIRLATGVCLVPQRQPVYTAKMVADLDFLSAGRVDFGVGIGWLKEEFDSLQMPFAQRAARVREYLAAMRALWQPGESTFSGDTVHIAPCHFNPKPIQQGERFAGPPVFFGGESEPALRRVAELGDGWYGFNLMPEQVAAPVQRLEQLLAQAGRSRSELQIAVGSREPIRSAEQVAAYAQTGIDQLVVALYASDLQKLETKASALRAVCASAE
ncbi:MAG: LLM class F420-dependent oxidoreductase, partial [Pseudomonadales bacterium]